MNEYNIFDYYERLADYMKPYPYISTCLLPTEIGDNIKINDYEWHPDLLNYEINP